MRDGGLIGHPFLAFSFQWNSRVNPDRKSSPSSVVGVHAWTDLRLERPFREGDVITIQGETIGLEQARPGVLSVDRYWLTDTSGALVAELDNGSIMLGGTLEGDPKPAPASVLPEVEMAAEPLWIEDISVSGDAAQIYTECAQIYNPIHTERRAALAAGGDDETAAAEVINGWFSCFSVRYTNGNWRGCTRPRCAGRQFCWMTLDVEIMHLE